MYGKFQEHLSNELAAIKDAGLYKEERLITTAQKAAIKVKPGTDVLNFCANNYLGLSDNPRLIKAAQDMMAQRGFGMSSVRFICGTQDIHKELEAAISDYFHTEDTILYGSCFDANGGLFEALLGPEDAIISDALMVCACAKPSAIAMLMPTWKNSKSASSKLKSNVSASSPPTVCSQWTAM